MFDISGDDISRLTDADLRTMVVRLAIAEIRRSGGPVSAVTAGGDQDASDGGIDVRVELPTPLTQADFLPRATVGFQVKKPDMPPSAITAEMRFNGTLRPVIGALAQAGGAYILVSAQGTVDDNRLGQRRQTMRDALDGHPDADRLHLDFYDRTRIASWVEAYPGVAAWVRSRIGRGLTGWSPIGAWQGVAITGNSGFLVDDAACLIDESSKGRETLTVLDGIGRLRARLAESGQCVRLVGLSGLGKTRLVQALFEADVGENPLDPALSIYTDYSEEPDPSARELARRLVGEGRRAILVVDNCNPQTHRELAAICSSPHSVLSLLTVEYDVRDDEPEHTDIFRLTGVSGTLLETWLEREASHVSAVDRRRIAQFSDGNFRIARALAATLRKGETLGQLKDRELFARLFDQRNQRNQGLLDDAQRLALAYSFDGEDAGPEGELATIGAAFGRSADNLYQAAAELRRRGILQNRGQWCAILPQAIANRLASTALEDIPTATLDRFCASLPMRLLRSFCTRLGFLHDSPVACAAVQRWLQPEGLMASLAESGENGFDLIRHLAPVMPELILDHLIAVLDGPSGPRIVALDHRERWRWHSLLKALAYEPALFDRAATALARFVAVEPERHNNNSATRPLSELFHMRLSGTLALPAQRQALVARWLDSDDLGLRRAGDVALDALLETAHFTSLSQGDFGARPRDYGWLPAIYGDIYDWARAAIGLAARYGATRSEVRAILARHLRSLWQIGPVQDAVEAAADALHQAGGWIGGWVALKSTQFCDRKAMPPDVADRLAQIIARLEPANLLDRARAAVLSHGSGSDLFAGEAGDSPSAAHKRAHESAIDIGRALAAAPDDLLRFLPELFGADLTARAHGFGRGLAAGCADLTSCWALLLAVYRTLPATGRNAMVLGGFLTGARDRDLDFCELALEALLDDPALLGELPYLQTQVSVEAPALDRLVRASERPGMAMQRFAVLGSGIVADCPAEGLAKLLDAIAAQKDGAGVALDIFQMRILCADDNPALMTDELVDCGRRLVLRPPLGDSQAMRNHWLDRTVELCLSGPDNADDARALCLDIRDRIGRYELYWHDAEKLIAGLFMAQPIIALDCFLLEDSQVAWELAMERTSPLTELGTDVLQGWADVDPTRRYPLLGRTLPMFGGRGTDDDGNLSEPYLALLRIAPDRRAFLAPALSQFLPSGWVGSLATRLEHRLALITGLRSWQDPAIDAWLNEVTPELERRIAHERQSEAHDEESFE